MSRFQPHIISFSFLSFPIISFNPYTVTLTSNLNRDDGDGGDGEPALKLEQLKALLVTKSMSSSSLDSFSLLDDDEDINVITIPDDIFPKEELDLDEDVSDDKRASLLMMNFPVAKVDFAINRLGTSAPIDELVDFIIAAEIAETENCDDSPVDNHIGKNEHISTEALFGTMDKTLQLLNMGFNEHEVSLAIEHLGSDVPITELANSICASQMGESYLTNSKNASGSSKAKFGSLESSWYRIKGEPRQSGDMFSVKMEEYGEDYASQMSTMSTGNMYANIKPKEEYYDESSTLTRDFNIDKMRGKRPKQEFEDDFTNFNGPLWKKKPKTLTIGNDPLPFTKTLGNKYAMPNPSNTSSGRGIDKMLCGPPYFFYGNVVNLSTEGWQKVSQFLYALEPEFVNSQGFSALNRKEGYIHNLPTEGQFLIKPKSPMTIEEAIPHTKKWWPSWDSRKQLSCINSETKGRSEICNHLGKMLKDSKGVLTGEQQTKLLYYCRNMNLVWAGTQRLAPVEPEHLDRILGYPINHTQNPAMTLVERLESLRTSYQTDTLGYHLSVLKPLFPGGITVLSLYSGIGGAEVALHRLGIYMKAVVSVESSEMKRKILRRWWQGTDQTGELVQIEDIQKLTSNKLEYLKRKFGEFDLVICESPCTYSEKGTKTIPGNSNVEELDFTLYYEFVRVLQRVRTMSGRR
ncbi:putative inactive DNA (cytosine-5)-methyltransferase DRM3 [Silene latifolia]|uniref:putative inactive DNA (cytosine-5)-methyltransferase DRM3 n=1 Tax=Silene latifolia TaxID=37657 RepID=UPI003D77DF76